MKSLILALLLCGMVGCKAPLPPQSTPAFTLELKDTATLRWMIRDDSPRARCKRYSYYLVHNICTRSFLNDAPSQWAEFMRKAGAFTEAK